MSINRGAQFVQVRHVRVEQQAPSRLGLNDDLPEATGESTMLLDKNIIAGVRVEVLNCIGTYRNVQGADVEVLALVIQAPMHVKEVLGDVVYVRETMARMAKLLQATGRIYGSEENKE